MTFTRRPTRPEPALPIVVGDAVVADDGSVGRVEQILRSENARPQFLVVSVRDRFRRRYPIVPSTLVGSVDRRRDVVHVHGDRSSIRGLSEALPLVV